MYKKGEATGRIKGTENKLTREIKRAFEELLECIDHDDIVRMANKLKNQPEKLYMILAKIAPKVMYVQTNNETVHKIEQSSSDLLYKLITDKRDDNIIPLKKVVNE